MQQEYLINDENEKKELSDYKPEGITSKLISVENGACWYVCFSKKGENKDTARNLSAVDGYIRSHFNVTVLRNDCSKYFNERLYPLMSQFERKLRKLLYVFSNINKDKESAKLIVELEKKNFNEIFTLLFIDDQFVKRIKDAVKLQNREHFSKREIAELVEGTEEHTVWSDLLGDKIVPTLREHYHDMRNIRNGIMHSHDISYKEFLSAQKLIKRINKEIDEALSNVSITEQIAKRQVSFGRSLAEALEAEELMMKKLYDSMAAIADSPIMEAAQKASQALGSFVDSPGMQAAYEAARKLDSLANSPAMVEAQKMAEQMSAIYKANPSWQKIADMEEKMEKGYQMNSTIASSQPIKRKPRETGQEDSESFLYEDSDNQRPKNDDKDHEGNSSKPEEKGNGGDPGKKPKNGGEEGPHEDKEQKSGDSDDVL